MLQQPSNRWLLEHWLSLRPDGALVPPKSAFRPEAFVERRLLPYISVIELVDDSLAIVRLAGTALRERYGWETTGRNFYELYDPQVRARTAAVLRQVFDFPYVQVTEMNQHRSDAPDLVTRVETLTCPMRNDSNGRPILLSCETALYDDPWLDVRASEVKVDRLEVLSRRFVDVGAGVPEAAPPPRPNRGPTPKAPPEASPEAIPDGPMHRRSQQAD
ncbi:PAS domain-containing protein [Rhodothalassium salexigens DSM 2132]|uniref:PAS domain-containing protein n=1 Tax=Rhodothalassium salexigens DSM 2132 TaxID=1188247 RepID=A0A4R2PRD1_RHOSA|nr:PAS domain-containing protein [Rhodothalassium salexigens]MBB4210122.1 hypothetical protein [Rhodothalassium salexigens DSM 2132]MBK1638446.1 hypothetical protein [Rhodothalassium salexigens DSM 2132]TCP38287.1 PAS domain-containing protein [Rhodothalassium salexigens DSM 2132]